MDDAAPRLRLGVVPGVAPGRWVDTWRERHRETPLDLVALDPARAETALLGGEVDVAFLRLPLRSPALVRIPLWIEETVVALPRENELTLLDALTPEDLAAETVIVPADDVLAWSDAPGIPFSGRQPPTSADALDLVAHEAGVCVLPKAIARELRRRDIELRELIAGADPVPVSQVGLAWLQLDTGEPSDLVEALIGIVRGRSENSTRGRTAPNVDPRQAANTRRASRPGKAARPRRGQSR